MRDPSGISKGSGFVAFSTPEEATEAVSRIYTLVQCMCEVRHFVVTDSGIMMLQMSQLSGKMVESKPLYVAIAQKKEDRRVRLQVCFSWNLPIL